MKNKDTEKLGDTETLDFHYLLALMPALQNEPEFAALPELFSIIGYKKLITLCKYAGGETIKIPTLTELLEALEALQYYYDVYLNGSKSIYDIPDNLKELSNRIAEILNDDFKNH